MTTRSRGLALYTYLVVLFNLGVILFGAFVRATGSGAGCGSHWPSCNGEVLPTNLQIETIIEFTHRATSGIALLLVIGLLVWVVRKTPPGHHARLGAWITLAFMISEALVGAALVRFGWVVDDSSVARTVVISIHLANTFMLLGGLTLTAWAVSGGERPRLDGHSSTIKAGLAFGLMGVLVLGVTGAITALGDTLFPAGSLAEGLQQDLDPNAHFLIRLRVWHPVIAILLGFYLAFVAGMFGMLTTRPLVKRLAGILIGLFVVQLAAGLLNVLLQVPVAMQLIHLLLADAVWIALLLLSLSVLSGGLAEERVERMPVSEPIQERA